MDQSEYEIMLDFTVMAENEIQRIKTGKAPGPSMRDCLGQWEATVYAARVLLANAKAAAHRKAGNPQEQ